MNTFRIRTRIVLAAITVLSLVASACGGATAAEQDLVFTEWEVVEMEGFPAENEVAGSFDFTEDRFRYNDGVNSASVTIEWAEDSFTVQASGDSTAVARDDGTDGNLRLFVEPGSVVTIEADGETLTLSSGSMSVTAMLVE